MTGVIYLVIIALWAAVLIPLWLRRHDQISEVRSTARFHSAMRSLSNSRHAEVAYSLAGEPGHMDDLDDGRYADSYGTYSYSTADARLRAADRDMAAHAAATRRGVVLGTLSAILLVTLLLAFAGMLPKWVPALTVLPVIGFLVASSMTASARSEQAPARRGNADQHRARTLRPVREQREATVAERPARESAPAAASAMMSDDEWANWNAWDDDSWDAVPTTLPTYVTAPRASQVPRRIDRSRPGEWTGEAMVETAQAMRTRPTGGSVQQAYAEPVVDAGAETAELPAVRAVNE